MAPLNQFTKTSPLEIHSPQQLMVSFAMDIVSVFPARDRAVLASFARRPSIKPEHLDASIFRGGKASLHHAAAGGHLTQVRGLLGVGADPTKRNERGQTPLMAARAARKTDVAHYIEWEHDELVRVLAKCLGRTPTQMEIYGAATIKKLVLFRQRVQHLVVAAAAKLLAAARDGDLTAVKRMLESGEIGLKVADKVTGETAWSGAVAHGRLAVCMYLREAGAPMEGSYWVSGERHSALVAAVLTGNVGFVRWIVGQDIPLATPTTERTCALTEAARLGSIEIVETLLEAGVLFRLPITGFNLPQPFSSLLHSIEQYTSSSMEMEVEPWLLLCGACWFQDHELFYYLLEKYPAFGDLVQQPRHAAIALFLAVYRENEVFADELLQRGAMINYPVALDTMTLHSMSVAVLATSTRMLQFLIARGGDVDALVTMQGSIRKPGHVQSLLERSIDSDAVECAMLLLPMETRPYHLEKALECACVRGNVELTSRLLDTVVPLNESILTRCASATACTLLLDLLLSRCCLEGIPITTLNPNRSADLELLNVYAAHGIDAHKSIVDSSSWE